MNLRRGAARVAGAALHASGALRFLHGRVLPGNVSVLMYHGLVAAPLPVPDWCFLTAARFERQMEYLARHFEVVHLEEAFAPGGRLDALSLDRGSFPQKKPLACVTFDDGFASVYELALPILERLRIPATVYLVTDLVDTGATVWFARLHQALSASTAREVRLCDLRCALAGPASRAAASSAFQMALKPLAPAAFAAALDDLLSQLGYGDARAEAPLPAFRILRRDEIRRMTRDDLVRFGGHTATHQILTRTTPDAARDEIERSLRAVAAIVERPSRTFAYPNGGPDDFDDDAVDVLRGADIDFAVSTVEGPNDRSFDPYAIRRYGIGGAHSLSRFAASIHHTRAVAKELVGRVRPG